MNGGEWLLDSGTVMVEKKKRLYSEGHQAALGANLSRGSPRHIVEQEEALTEAPQNSSRVTHWAERSLAWGTHSRSGAAAPPCQGEELGPWDCVPVLFYQDPG